jgi:glycosyltransferase involved in cell wall biosynthesis
MLVGITHHQTCLVLGPRLTALRKAGLPVALLSGPGKTLDRTAAEFAVECIRIPMERGIAPWSDLCAFIAIWRLLGRVRPGVVEFGTPKAGFLGMVASALRGVPHRVYLLRGLKLESARGLKRRLLVASERLASGCADVVLSNSASLREKAIELKITSPEKLVVLGKGSSIGVDLTRFRPGECSVRAQLGIDDAAPVIGYVGRLTRDKGLPVLIRAFDRILKSFPNAVLLVVGWFDASEDALNEQERAAILNHPQIHWTGFQEDTSPWYRAMDVFVLPTFREGFPNVVLEAQATGVPVVTTTATGARDSVLPGVTGELVPPGDAEALALAVMGLLGDAGLRRQMGVRAREWVREHFSAEQVLGRVTEFYQGMLNEQC